MLKREVSTITVVLCYVLGLLGVAGSWGEEECSVCVYTALKMYICLLPKELLHSELYG
jgi:hypothetical protein